MKRKKKASYILGNLAMEFFLGIVAVLCLYPILYIIFASFSDPLRLVQHTGLLFKPLGFTLKGYDVALSYKGIFTGYMNTAVIVVLGTLINMVMTVLGAYALSRKEMYTYRFLNLFFVFTMFFSGGLIPTYILIKKLGLIDSLFALILPVAINTWNLIILRTTISGLPESLVESARIDGADESVFLFKLIVPLVKPTLAVLVLYYIVGHWNSWFNAMIYIRDADKMPLQMFLRDILTRSQLGAMAGQMEVEDVGQTIKYATIIVSTVPILCVYPFIQKHFVKGVMVGAVKE